MELVLKSNVDQSIDGVKSFIKAPVFKAGATFASPITYEEALSNDANIGVVGAATAVATESGDGVHHITTIVLTDFIVGALAGAAAAKTLVPVTPLYTLPAGVQLRSASYADLGVTAAGTAKSPEIGLGTVAGDGSANATIGAAGATMEDVLEGYAVATTATGAQVVSSAAALGFSLEAAAKTVYVNAAATWAADNTGNLTVSGKVVLVWDTIE